MRPEAQPASANNNPIVTMRRMIANPLQAFSSQVESLGGSENATKHSFSWARFYQNHRDLH
jgi:hypothetical protein